MADELLKALGQLQRAQQSGRTRDGPELDPDEQASILAAVLGDAPADTGTGTDIGTGSDIATGTDIDRGTTAGVSPAEAVVPAAVGVPVVGGGTVVPLARARARRGWLAGLTSLAAAAAVFVVLRAGEGDDAVDLPSYSITRADGEADARGSEPTAEVVRLRSDTAIDWILAPAQPAVGPVGLRLVATQGDVRRWIGVDAVQSISADGVIRLRGRAGAWLELPPGPWTLTFVIARPERLPSDLDTFVRGSEQPARHGWQLQQRQVQIEG